MHWLAGVTVAALILVLPANGARADLSLSSEPAVVGQVNTVSGCGYVPLHEVEVYFLWDEDFTRKWDHLVVRWMNSDAGGCFAMDWVPTTAGLYKIRVDQVIHSRDHLQAQTIFEAH